MTNTYKKNNYIINILAYILTPDTLSVDVLAIKIGAKTVSEVIQQVIQTGQVCC